MRKLISALFALVAFVTVGATAIAASQGTPDEAKALVEKAITVIKSEGKDKAFAAFNSPTGGYVDRDLYVFVYDLEGTVISHGGNNALIGKSLFNLKDADGKTFVQEFVSVAKGQGEGWVDYKWVNPTTRKVESKTSFIKRHGDMLVGVGVYKG
jgi:cytochrome c